MRSSANVYSLPEHLRATSMCSIVADTDNHSFIIGTSPAKASSASGSEQSEIHVVTYAEYAHRIDVQGVYEVPA